MSEILTLIRVCIIQQPHDHLDGRVLEFVCSVRTRKDCYPTKVAFLSSHFLEQRFPKYAAGPNQEN